MAEYIFWAFIALGFIATGFRIFQVVKIEMAAQENPGVELVKDQLYKELDWKTPIIMFGIAAGIKFFFLM